MKLILHNLCIAFAIPTKNLDVESFAGPIEPENSIERAMEDSLQICGFYQES